MRILFYIDAPKGIVLPSYMRYYDKTQEAEAEYLGAALQLPRECLVWALTHGNMSKKEVAKNYSASSQMVNYRINSKGIRNQLRYIET